jgi:hypothetical protein
MCTPHEKGNALEQAVESIERYILNHSPSLKEKPFLIESKKIINVNGVRHEIDIFVTIDHGDGYRSIFIFECKNWQDSVGKNELIIFAEKITASQAQHGYFVAKSFTKDAEAQAVMSPRMSLLIASDPGPTLIPTVLAFDIVQCGNITVAATFYVRGSGNSVFDPVDLDKVEAKLSGKEIDLREYVTTWGREASDIDVRSFRSHKVAEGSYERTAAARRDYAVGDLMLNGRDMERCDISVRYELQVARPAVISSFEIESRGRVAFLAPVQIGSGPMMQVRLISRQAQAS